MRFSVITITYNAAKTLPVTLQSVAEQHYADIEHIIIDGNSTDTTCALIKAAQDKVAYWKSEPDKGLYDAMNKGLRVATGDYLIFLNAGDTFTSANTLQQAVDAIPQGDMPQLIYADTLLVNKKREVVGKRHLNAPKQLTAHSFAMGMLVCHQAFWVARNIAPLYNLDYKYSADYDWCIRCLQKIDKSLFLPFPTIHYLEEGITTLHHKASLKERYKIMAHYYGALPTAMRHLYFALRHLIYRFFN